MPNLTFELKRNDLLPTLTVAATYDDGSIIDLTAATSPKFLMRLASAADLSTPKINAAATVVSGPAGTIRYTWQGTDTDTAGVYIAEFQVHLGGKPITIPGNGTIKVVILADLG